MIDMNQHFCQILEIFHDTKPLTKKLKTLITFDRVMVLTSNLEHILFMFKISHFNFQYIKTKLKYLVK